MGVSGPDVMLSPKARKLFGFSVEVKNQEKPSLRRAWGQTEANAGEHEPLLFNTWNRGPELVTIKASCFFKLMEKINAEGIQTHN